MHIKRRQPLFARARGYACIDSTVELRCADSALLVRVLMFLREGRFSTVEDGSRPDGSSCASACLRMNPCSTASFAIQIPIADGLPASDALWACSHGRLAGVGRIQSRCVAAGFLSLHGMGPLTVPADGAGCRWQIQRRVFLVRSVESPEAILLWRASVVWWRVFNSKAWQRCAGSALRLRLMALALPRRF